MIHGITLALDGSTYSGSVAVIGDDVILAEHALPRADKPGRSGRDENFMPMVAAALRDAGVKKGSIDRVVCGEGPGSFTSLRIAASIAKGIAVGVGCPLFAVSSLVLMASDRGPGKYLAALPAMRGEAFVAIVDVGADGTLGSGRPIILSAEAIESYALENNATLVNEIPHARAARPILRSIVAAGPRHIDSWEPDYGRLAEAQVKWEATHGRPLPTT